MNPKATKKTFRMLVALVIAFAMIGMPATVFTYDAAADGDGNGEADTITGKFPIVEPDYTEPATADPYGNITVYFHDFDGTIDTADWTIFDGYPTAPYGSPDSIVWENTSLVPATWSIFEYNYSAPNSMFLNASDSDSLVINTGVIDATAITEDLQLTFYSTIWQTGSVDIEIYDGTGFLIDTVTVSDRMTWMQYTVDLTGYEGTTFQLAFHVYGEEETVFIDDVLITGDNRPDYDVSVEGFTELNCGGRMNTMEKELEVIVANWGNLDAGLVPFHFQIYHEEPLDCEPIQWWDMEECILNTWIAESYDEHPESTWYWTEKRANSPTHSFHTQPDNLPSYEAYSNDSLILEDWFFLNSTYNDEPVQTAYLTLAHWCEGEFDGTNAVDYGTIYIHYDSDLDGIEDGVAEIAGPIYDTGGEWEELFGEDGFDISDYIGMNIKVEFNWKSDATNNYEGWYIDDVNIDVCATAPQPLVWDGYKMVDLPAETEKTITSQLDWVPEEDGQYYVQVYVADNWTAWYEDFDMTNNEINCSLWIGDICDPAMVEVTVPPDVILDSDVGYVEIPINTTIYNNGTLTKDVPVQVSAAHLIKNTIFFDDMESGDVGWDLLWDGTGDATDYWTITDTDFYGASPYNSWALIETGVPLGHGKIWPDDAEVGGIDPFVEGGLQMEAKIKYDLPGPPAENYGAMPVLLGSAYYWDFGGISVDANHEFDSTAVDRVNPWAGNSGGWVDFNADEFINSNTLYWEERYGDAAAYPQYVDYFNETGEVDGLAGLLEFWRARYEIEQGVEDFSQVQIGFLVQMPTPLSGDQGFWFDNFELYNEYAGETIWTSETIVVEDLGPGETGYANFTWNSTEYCDFLITGEVLVDQMDCEGNDPTNDEATDTTRIHEWQYIDDYEDVGYDDNTCGDPAQWKIVEECSLCPDDSFWWNGGDATYNTDRDDVLQIDETFNFTDTVMAYLNFSHYYYIEDDFDYGYVEVSNDSGMTWFILDEFTGDSGGAWMDMSYIFEVGTTVFFDPYTNLSFGLEPSFFTEDMHFRFRFYSDAFVVEKGWYIDDVSIDMFNGTTWTTLFSDDMESGAENWYTGYVCYGNHWHNTSGFGDGPTDEWWYNGEERYWDAPGFAPVNATYSLDPLPSYWSSANVGINGFIYNESYGWDFITIGAGAEAYFNQTGIVLPGGGPIELRYITWGLGGAGAFPPDWYHWVEVTNGVDTMYWNVTVPGYADTLITLDLSMFAGDTIDISLHHNGTCLNDFYGWFNCGIPCDYYQPFYDSFEIWGINPAFQVPTLNQYNYYNNVDEKIIFEYDLTHAFEGILYWEQNYSMAAYPEDYGVVEIWDDGAWKALYIVQGNTGGAWSTASIDISDYVGGDENTKIRFRFISNSTGTDYGWLIDNVRIDGKVDFEPPTATCELDPATPDGNNGWYVSDVTFTLSATDNTKVDSIKYRINGGNWLTYTGPVTIDDDGEYIVEYYAIDQVGNEGTVNLCGACAPSFKIDQTNPTGSLNFPQTGYIYLFGNELMPRILFKDKALIIGGLTATASASDSGSGVDYMTFTTGAGSANIAAPYEYNLPFYFPFGSDTLTVGATDIAGNTATGLGSCDYLKIL